MDIHSYDGCLDCLMRACCSQVCESYKKFVLDRFKLKILVETMGLKTAESIVDGFIKSEDYYIEHPVSLLDRDYKFITKHRR